MSDERLSCGGRRVESPDGRSHGRLHRGWSPVTVRRLLRALYEGPAAVQLRRFVAVGTVAAGVQLVLLWAFVERVGLHYVISAAVAIEITILLQYVVNNAWTFRSSRNAGPTAYLVGLLKTNLVRGSAIPLQVGILYLFVAWVGVPYLLGNVGAIGLSGLYRYTLDSRWTWAG